jgi:hypothetical protein
LRCAEIDSTEEETAWNRIRKYRLKLWNTIYSIEKEAMKLVTRRRNFNAAIPLLLAAQSLRQIDPLSQVARKFFSAKAISNEDDMEKNMKLAIKIGPPPFLRYKADKEREKRCVYVFMHALSSASSVAEMGCANRGGKSGQ